MKINRNETLLPFSFVGSPSFPLQKESNLGVVEYKSVRKFTSEANHLRGHYQRFSDEDRLTIGKYAAVHGPMATIKKFKAKFPYLKESTARTFRKKYPNTLKRNKGSSSTVKKLATMTRGRPLMFGKLDEKVKNFLLALRRKGVVNAIAASTALIQKSNEEHLKLIELEKSSLAKGQMTKPVKQKMKKNHIIFVRISANMTNIFQPLELTINRFFKFLMKSKI